MSFRSFFSRPPKPHANFEFNPYDLFRIGEIKRGAGDPIKRRGSRKYLKGRIRHRKNWL